MKIDDRTCEVDKEWRPWLSAGHTSVQDGSTKQRSVQQLTKVDVYAVNENDGRRRKADRRGSLY